jgi:hypothetical protein
VGRENSPLARYCGLWLDQLWLGCGSLLKFNGSHLLIAEELPNQSISGTPDDVTANGK